MTDTLDTQTVAAVVERKKLQRHFGRFDILFFLICTIVGLGSSWFGSDFIPEGWTYAQRFTYLWTELTPVLIFIVIGTLFWWMGRRTRAQAATPELEELS